MSKVVTVHEVYAMAKELGLEDLAVSYAREMESALEGLADAVAEKLDIEVSFGPYLDVDGLFVHMAGDSEKAKAFFDEHEIDPTGEF